MVKPTASNFNARPGRHVTPHGSNSTSTPRTESGSDVPKTPERILEKLFAGETEHHRADLIERLHKAFANPEVKLEEHPHLQAIHQQINDVMGSSPAQTLTTLSPLSTEQINSLLGELNALPRPILHRASQAFIRVLNEGVAEPKELKKIQTSGAKHVSPMTLVGEQAPFKVYDTAAWANRSGLVFSSETCHVAGYKTNVRSHRLADHFSPLMLHRHRAYKAAFSRNPAGDPAKLFPLLNGAFNQNLSDLPTLTQKYVEMNARRQGEIPDRSSKHELVEFLRAHCGFDDQNIRPFAHYQAAFKVALAQEPDPAKRSRLTQGVAKLEAKKASAQKEYLKRGAAEPKKQKYQGLNTFGHNEHLCLPQTNDVEGVYTDLSKQGMAHALSVQDALATSQFAPDQQRLYTYHPHMGLSLVSREEIKSLQDLIQKMESEQTHEEALAVLDTHLSQFPDPDSLKRLLQTLIRAKANDAASSLFLSHFNPSELSNDLKCSFLRQSCKIKSYPIARTLFRALPTEDQGNLLQNPEVLVGLMAAFGHDSQGLSELKSLIDANQIDLNPENSKIGIGLAYDAAQHGHLDAFPVLKAWGSNLNGNGTWLPPVHAAALNGQAATIKALAECGANLDQATPKGLTPARLAVNRGHAEVIKVLAEEGVNLNTGSINFRGPILNTGGIQFRGAFMSTWGIQFRGTIFNRARPSPLISAPAVQNPKAIDALHRYAGIFQSTDHAQKTLEKKLILYIRAVQRGEDPQAAIDTIAGLRDDINNPENKQRLFDRLLASESFSYRKQSTGYLVAQRATITPEVRIAILGALGDTGIVSSLHQERKKLDDWCAAPGKQLEALHKVANYIDTRSVDLATNPAQNAHMLKSFATDMQRIDQWLGQIEASCSQHFEQEKLTLKSQLLKAYHTATSQPQALLEAYQALPSFQGKSGLWQEVSGQPSILSD